MRSSGAFARVLLSIALVGANGAHAFASDSSPEPSSAPAAAPSALAPTPASDEEPAKTALATSLVAQAQSGKIDRSLFETKTSEALTQALVDNVARKMAPLGKPKSITFESHATVGRYDSYHYRIAWDSVAVDESFALNPDGKIVGWYFQPTS